MPNRMMCMVKLVVYRQEQTSNSVVKRWVNAACMELRNAHPETVTISGFAMTIGLPPNAAHWSMRASMSALLLCLTLPSGSPSPSVPCAKMKSQSSGSMTTDKPRESILTAPRSAHVKCRHLVPIAFHMSSGRSRRYRCVTSPLVIAPAPARSRCEIDNLTGTASNRITHTMPHTSVQMEGDQITQNAVYMLNGW